MSYDPDVIHQCETCGRSYAVRPIEGMNKWHFYNVFCSLFCAKDDRERERHGLREKDEEVMFRYFLNGARQIYRSLLAQIHNHGKVINPEYYIGWYYKDPHPYRFASEFMDRIERMIFLSARERAEFANDLFDLTNTLHQERS